jgi:hypothetical protein
MASGEIVVGDKPSTRKPTQRTVESMAERAGAKTAKPGSSKPAASKPASSKPAASKRAPSKSDLQKRDLLKPVGAMSQQRSDGGTYSVPQEFVHLVGCCDPQAQPSRSGRPRPAAAKARSSKT